MPGSCSTMRWTLESAGTRRGHPGVEQGIWFMGTTITHRSTVATKIPGVHKRSSESEHYRVAVQDDPEVEIFA